MSFPVAPHSHHRAPSTHPSPFHVCRVQELFRSLGCVLVAPSAEDRDRLVATGRAATAAEAMKSKKAKLQVPLQFPKERKVKAKR